jgi:hypothetical protein
MTTPDGGTRFGLALGAVATIVGIPLCLAGTGLGAYFTGDDMMNLYGAWSKPWKDLLLDNLRYYSPAYRPLGALFYRSLFGVFGFHPLPFRVMSFAILFANLGLVYVLARRLTDCREAALLTVLLSCYHAHFADLYYSTGTIYDLLCCTFYAAALGLYASWRRAGRYLRWRQILAIAALYICALNAKEMAVTLPLTLLFYELVYHRPSFERRAIVSWLARVAGVAGLLALITVPYLLGKLSQASPFSQVGDYHVHAGLGVYLDNYRHYLDLMFYRGDGWFTPARAALLLGGMLVAALISRRKALLFSSMFIFYSVLPVSFIAPRGTIFVLYIPFLGWSLFAATLILALRDRLSGFIAESGGARRMGPALTFAFLAVCLFAVHSNHTYPPPASSVLRSTVVEMHALVPRLPANSRLLFLDDPFPSDLYDLLMCLRLSYGDNTLQVDRAKIMPSPPSAGEVKRYDVVLAWRDGHLLRVH